MMGYRLLSKLTIPQLFRFISRIKMNDPRDCWEWSGCKTKGHYAQFSVTNNKVKETAYVHRIAYNHWRGPIKNTLDHLCRNRSCVNPWHLEDITLRENINRGFGHNSKRRKCCKRGHEYTLESTYYDRSGSRECRICIQYRKTRSNQTSEVTS